jgi:hypothetical protein
LAQLLAQLAQLRLAQLLLERDVLAADRSEKGKI